MNMLQDTDYKNNMEKETEIKKYFKKVGSKGGTSTLNKHGKKHFSDIGKKGLATRWGKPKKKK